MEFQGVLDRYSIRQTGIVSSFISLDTMTSSVRTLHRRKLLGMSVASTHTIPPTGKNLQQQLRTFFNIYIGPKVRTATKREGKNALIDDKTRATRTNSFGRANHDEGKFCHSSDHFGMALASTSHLYTFLDDTKYGSDTNRIAHILPT